MSTINITGKLLGRRLRSNEPGVAQTDLVKIEQEFRPDGPADNSILAIKYFKDGVVAGYIPWVGYFDLDREIAKDGSGWEIVEPATLYVKENVTWKPFKSAVIYA